MVQGSHRHYPEGGEPDSNEKTTLMGLIARNSDGYGYEGISGGW